MPTTYRQPHETFAGYTDLVVEVCCSCGVMFAMPRMLQGKALADHGRFFYCPNGHDQHYTGKTEAQKLREQLDQTRDSLARARSQRDQAQAEISTQKGRATRFKNERDRERKRVHNGVCPCCKRSFANLARHMQSQHPNFADGKD